jgi:hypothetical protein|tara:strand:+ start:384 stop:590 length:207 start_codon:yes stop_codon:yes gene_type:complete
VVKVIAGQRPLVRQVADLLVRDLLCREIFSIYLELNLVVFLNVRWGRRRRGRTCRHDQDRRPVLVIEA